MYRGKVHNGDGDSRRSESRGSAARSSTNTTKSDRLFERFVRLIGVPQIREAVMSAAWAAGAVGKVPLIYQIFSCRYGFNAHTCILIFVTRRESRDRHRAPFLSPGTRREKDSGGDSSGYGRRNQFCYIARRDDKAAAKTIDRFGRHRSLYAARCRTLSANAAERKREIRPTLMKVTAALASTNDDFR